MSDYLGRFFVRMIFKYQNKFLNQYIVKSNQASLLSYLE